MANEIENALVKIYDKNGAQIVGAGFLATCSQVITCAHVISKALGLADDHDELPTNPIYLDFPLLQPPSAQIPAVVRRWEPALDIALIELLSDPPQGSQPIPLRGCENYAQHHFRVCGFPQDLPAGDWVEGSMLGRTGDGFIHVEADTAHRITMGFSGGPVWDMDANQLAGIVVASFEAEPDDKVAYFIPAEIILDMFPRLRPEPQPGRTFRYACYISFPTPADELVWEAAQDIRNCLRKELGAAIADNVIYMDNDRIQNDLEAAAALCESACMLMVYTQRYFDARHPFCAREFRAMQLLENIRLRALGIDLSEQHSLIVPVALRGTNSIPHAISAQRRVYNFESHYVVEASVRNRNKEFKTSVKQIADHVANHWYLLQDKIPNPCGNCPEFRFPAEQDILDILTNWKPRYIF